MFSLLLWLLLFDLFVFRHPVTDELRKKHADDWENEGQEELQKGMPVKFEEYNLIIVLIIILIIIFLFIL